MYTWELKLFHVNDFTDIPSLDYFAVDVTKRRLDAVMDALNAVIRESRRDASSSSALTG
jgi:hypothetical protein